MAARPVQARFTTAGAGEEGLTIGSMLGRAGSSTVCVPVPPHAGQVVSASVSPVPEHALQGTTLVATSSL